MRSTPARAFRKMNLSVVLIIFVAASESRAVAGRRSQREGGCLAVAEEAGAFRCDLAGVAVLVVEVSSGCPRWPPPGPRWAMSCASAGQSPCPTSRWSSRPASTAHRCSGSIWAAPASPMFTLLTSRSGLSAVGRGSVSSVDA